MPTYHFFAVLNIPGLVIDLCISLYSPFACNTKELSKTFFSRYIYVLVADYLLWAL